MNRVEEWVNFAKQHDIRELKDLLNHKEIEEKKEKRMFYFASLQLLESWLL